MKHLVLGLFVSISTLLTFLPAIAEAKGNPLEGTKSIEATEHRKLAKNKTIELTTKLADFHKANNKDKAQQLNTLVELAKARKALLADLVKTDPAGVLKTAIPAHIRANMPEAVAEYIETATEVEGEYEVQYEDYADGSARLRHFVKNNGKRTELFIADKAHGRLSGEKVRAHGVKVDTAMAVESGDAILTLAADGSADGGSNGGTAAPTANTLGEQRTLVMLVNFQDQPDNKPWTQTEAHDMVFGTVSDFFYENSYQQTWLAGDVRGWYTLSINSTDACSTDLIYNQADAAATAAGVDLSAYNRLLYVFPQNTCGWSGISNVGGNPSRSSINGDFALEVVGHELGHALGLYHSHGLDCVGGALATNCDTLEYADVLDIMGGRAAHINAFQKQWLGWLDYNSSPAITTIDASGTYFLPPLETTATGAKALRILRNIDPITGSKSWYYLEYRQGIGFDSFLAQAQSYLSTDNVTNGVILHLATEGDRNSSLLLDMTPESYTSFIGRDLFDPALETGYTYVDTEAGITITTEQADSTGVTVSVSFDQQTSCALSSPTIMVSPPASQVAEAGDLITYNVQITNNSSSACASSSYDLSASLPGSWSASFAGQSLNLASGATASTTLDVISATSATDGVYDILVSANSSTNSAYGSSDTVTYQVSNTTAANALPVAVDDIATLTQISEITINVQANDWDPENDQLVVVSTTQGAKGAVRSNGDGTLTYTPAKRFKNSDSFSYTISDGHGTATATVKVSLQTSGNDGGSGGKGGGKGRK